MTSKERILQRLIQARLSNEKYILHDFNGHRNWISGGYLPMWEIQKVGGTSGDRRIREIREDYPIDMKRHEWQHEDKKINTFVYRLDMEPKKIVEIFNGD